MALNRMNPDGMYTPNKGIYSQVVTSTGTTTVHIAGTVPFDEDANVVGVGDMKAQTCQILDNLRISLEAAGALPADVVRINVYTLNTDDYVANGAPEVIAFFGDTKPSSTTVQVSRLVHPDWLVEIEATAVID
jgi:enamine deaminase RidA (YjgF/YER057c/UK114 family)|tara:strand:- start:1431 stop:1829 length:399 start_codon:yes stop_codon:yes gene_type:complete